MMTSEFIERTGYEPSNDEYYEIEQAYYNFPGNKDKFCKAWKEYHDTDLWSAFVGACILLDGEEQKRKEAEKRLAQLEEPYTCPIPGEKTKCKERKTYNQYDREA